LHAVAEAQQAKEVAALALETAKLGAQKTITEAKAEADAKRLQVAANNNLQERLEAYVDVQKAWADAYGKQRQTPDVVMGQGTNGSPLNASMEALSVKAMQDLRVQAKP
jgi:hypothetical protein